MPLDDLIEERGALSSLAKAGDTLAYVRLSLPGEDLASLDGLEEFPLLRSVDVSRNLLAPAALAPLAALRGLRTLRVDGNPLGGAPLLDALPAGPLEELHAARCGLEGAGALSALPRQAFVRRLGLAGNELRSLEPLGALVRLEEVDLSGNAVEQVGLREALPVLARLDVSRCGARSFTGLAPQPLLQEVLAHDNCAESLEGLERHPRLVRLLLAGNAVSSLDEVARLRALPVLEELDLRGNPVAALPGYRAAAVHWLRGLATLDGEPVTAEERVRADAAHGVHDEAEAEIARRILPDGDRTTPEGQAARQLALEAAAASSSSAAAAAAPAVVPVPLPRDVYWTTMVEYGLTLEWQDAFRRAQPEGAALDFSGGAFSAGDVGLWAAARVLSEHPGVASASFAGALHPGRWSACLSDQHGLAALGAAAASHPRLAALDLSRCDIGLAGVEALAAAVRGARSLRRLVLAGNRTGGERGAVACLLAAAAARPEGAGLARLDLARNGMGADAAGELADAMRRDGTFPARELVLDGNDLGGAAGALLLAGGLASLRGPRQLDLLSLGGGALPPDAAEVLCVALSQRCRGVAALVLSGTRLTADAVSALARLLTCDDCGLRSLRLSGCGLDAGAARELASAARANASLRELDLSGNPAAGGPGLAAVLEALADRSAPLESLDARGLALDDEGAAELMRWFRLAPPASPVRHVRLGPGRLSADGGASVARAVCVGGHGLETLDVRGLGLGPRSVAALADRLEESALRELALDGNELDAATWSGLCSALRISCSLERLSLGAARARLGSADDERRHYRELVRSAGFNGTVRVLSLDGSALGAAALDGLAEGFASVRPGTLPGISLQGVVPAGTSPEGLARLAAALAPAVHRLELGGNGLDLGGGGGGADLASALLQAERPAVRELGLAGNVASPGAFAALSSLCGAWSRLERLALPDACGDGANRDDLVSLVSSGVQQAHSLRTLDFGRLLPGGMSEAHRRALLLALQCGNHHVLRRVLCDGEGRGGRAPTADAGMLENALAARVVTNRMM